MVGPFAHVAAVAWVTAATTPNTEMSAVTATQMSTRRSRRNVSATALVPQKSLPKLAPCGRGGTCFHEDVPRFGEVGHLGDQRGATNRPPLGAQPPVVRSGRVQRPRRDDVARRCRAVGEEQAGV